LALSKIHFNLAKYANRAPGSSPTQPAASSPPPIFQAGQTTHHETESDDESEDEVRPNKFKGSSRKWYGYTANERRIATTLEQLQAGDLSIHLYNAFALKRKLRSDQPPENLQPWQGKRRWIDKSKEHEWAPAPVWTAWPLRPEFVPDIRENFAHKSFDEPDDVYQLVDPGHRARRELQGLILGIILEQAKNKWNERVWESESGTESRSELDNEEEKDAAEKPFIILGRGWL